MCWALYTPNTTTGAGGGGGIPKVGYRVLCISEVWKMYGYRVDDDLSTDASAPVDTVAKWLRRLTSVC